MRACHESLNGWLKNWGILSQVFRHHITLHGTAFRACAVVTQITIADCGKSLFEADYDDGYYEGFNEENQAEESNESGEY